ncbi:hypothetical protein PPL_01389 [Heterostelium album PN500]|uniref:Carbohydrate binding domain-containing protein n=1 Tax=Heterostelium pallidum (strain ATCC 26659 / Pp 5 / PN500) TaxID=670386 RepID=D3AZ49_HETP5|nr:hypothetical protein PPL_01389 [Heterostelium album PN500]EFA85606.1 hypothetical protein PPL_01389 [Heterostelium album PN500]|eukprot:XP_020437713.1 hypothetical protein PPL_01389 [Heterostelium album PN500]
MKLLLLLVIAVASIQLASAFRCADGLDQAIFRDSLHVTTRDWSWAGSRMFNCTTPVHSGTHSFSFVPRNYEGLYFNLQTPIDPSRHSMVSLWVHGGGVGNQKIYVRLTSNKVAVTRDYFLWGPQSILVNCSDVPASQWAQAVVNLDLLEPGFYDGIQILTHGQDLQARVYIDDVEVIKRCPSDPFKKTLPTSVCNAADCISVKVVETPTRWNQNGVEYQQYAVTFKNTSGKTFKKVEFEKGYFLPRDKKDIWGCQENPGDRWTLPNNMKDFPKGTEFTVGCVSQRGPVSFKVVYVEVAK